MGVKNISFTTITDYLILIIFVLELIGESKTEYKRLIKDYSETVERLHSLIPNNTFNQIMSTDFRNKLDELKKHI